MIITEEEARTKWCPHARGAAPFSFRDSETAVTSNRVWNAEPLEGTTCIGSRCMAWRWDDEGNRARSRDRQMNVRVPGDPPQPEPPEPAERGFCGLAYSVRLP